MRFVDTNVLLYVVDTRPEAVQEHERAKEIMNEAELALSIQVLQEFYVQATRSTRPGAVSHETDVAFIKTWSRFRIQETTLAVFERALATRKRYGLDYWDAAIIEAARAVECETVLSEDLSDGQDYGGVRVMNPFRP